MSEVSTKRMVARYEADVTDVRSKLSNIIKLHEDMERKTEASGRRSQEHARTSLQSMNQLRLSAVTAAGAITGAFAAATGGVFMNLASQATALENQMKGFGATTDETKKKVYALAMETRTPIESTVGLLRSMSNALRGQDFETTLRQVGTLNRLITTGGLGEAQRGSLVLQFGQALQSGTLSGDEMASLRENAPYELLDAIAKRAGGTVEQLRKLGSEGKITRDVMVGALNDLESVSKEKFGNFNMTVGESLTVFKTGLIAVAGQVDDTLGVTSALSEGMARLGSFFVDHADAAASLAAALGTVAQLALLAAGARGIAALTASAGPALASVLALRGGMTALNATMISTVAAQKALGGLLSLLGGPIGAAAFATGAAMLILARNSESAAEALERAQDHASKAAGIRQELQQLSETRATDARLLAEKERDIEKAIQDQAVAAQSTAQLEKLAIQGRIKETEALIAAKRRLLEEEERDAQQARDRAMTTLAATARPGLSQAALSDPRVLKVLGPDAEASDQARVYATYLNAKEQLTERERKWLSDYTALAGEITKVEQEKNTREEQAFSAHVRLFEQQMEKFQKETSEYVAKANERQDKLDQIEKRRSALEALRAKTMGTSDPELVRERTRLNVALRALDQEEQKLLNTKDRVAEVRKQFEQLKKDSAVALQFDPSGEAERRMGLVEYALREIEKAGEDVNKVQLSSLEAALFSVGEVASTVIEKFKQIAGTSFDAVGANFDRMNAQMGGAAPYANEMAVASAATSIIDVIKKHEGFDPNGRGGNAYWDVNHWRAGYGSDQIYKKQEDGSWVMKEVVQGMRVTQEEANYSLMMRLSKEFIPSIISAIGQDKWNAMNTGQQASLASLGWNYGNGSWTQGALRNVTEAVRNGTAQDIANAIAARAMDNPELKGKDGLPVNYHRRMSEAAPFGDTSSMDAAADAIVDKTNKANAAAEELAQKQKNYLESITDENELRDLKLKLVGKEAAEQERILLTHEKTKEAIAAGYKLDDISPLNAKLTVQQQINEEVNREMSLRKQTADAEKKHAEEQAALQERLNTTKEFQKSVESDIQALIVGSITKTGDWKDMAMKLVEKLAEAFLYAGLFNEGGLASGAGKGLLGGFSDLLTGWLTKSATGNIMTSEGPLPLRKYANGGIAYSPQLSLFGEGRTPEAYVPLPDGRTIPVTIKVPDVPSAGGLAGNHLDVNVNLNTQYLHADIESISTGVSARITERGINRFSKKGLPQRVNSIQQDPGKR